MQERVLSEAFQEHEPESVLEVGCGTGRLFHIYKNVQGWKVGVDLNLIQLHHAKDKAARYHVQLEEMSAYGLTFDDGAFDCLVYSEVLLHIPPEGIRKAISEACRVSRRLIFLVDNYCEDCSEIELREIQSSAAPHCFVYKYSQLFQGQDFLVNVSKVPFTRNAVYVLNRSAPS